MSEGILPVETKPKFSDRNISILEARMFGNTYPVPIGHGQKIVVDEKNILDIYKKFPRLLRVPMGILSNTETIEDVNRARKIQEEVTGMALTLFGMDGFAKMHKMNVKPFSRLVAVGEDGQIPNIEIFFRDIDDNDMDLEEGDENEFLPADEYVSILQKGRIVNHALVFDFK